MSQLRENKKISGVLDAILHPGREYTPIPFWFFDDEPTEEKLRSQLRDMNEKGVNGFVLHPRIGIPESISYLSGEYFRWIRFIVREADRLEMKVVLYDEGMYPSGSAHGMVVAQNPGFASRGIRMAAADEVRELFGKKVNSEDNGCKSLNGKWQLVAALSDDRGIVYGNTGGTIRGIHFGEDDGQNPPAAADILNPEAVDLFIRLTHDRYYEELKEYFGNTIIAFFTDEPSALGRCAGGFREWLPGMEEEIAQAGGRLEDLAAVFEQRPKRDSENPENTTVAIYRGLVKKHLRENFYAKLSKWCTDHNIVLMGHPAESDDVEEELFFQIPGQDLILRRVAPETGGLREFDSVQAKLTADLARHLGRERNANECFGVCNRPPIGSKPKQINEELPNPVPWYFTGRDMKWYFNWLGARGVNLFVPHAFYYSVEGERKGERPPDVGPHNIWWPHYRRISDYVKRISYLMTGSDDCASVAVLCDNNRVPYLEVADLYERQITFHYLPIALIREGAAKVRDGKLCIRHCEYEVVLNVTDPAWDTLLEGKVRIVHDTAEITGQAIPTKEPCADLRMTRLVKEGVDMVLLSNEGREPVTVALSAEALFENAASKLVTVDLWRGTRIVESRDKLVENGWVTRTVEPCEMLLLLPDVQGVLPETEAVEPVELGDLTGGFVPVPTEDENRRVYEQEYLCKDPHRPVAFTVVGEEMAECFLNGKLVDFSLYGPHRFVLGEGLQAGINRIRVIFTGNAANLYGNAAIPFGLGVDNERVTEQTEF